MKVTLTSIYKTLLADTLTPISIYLKIREHFANSILLESSDYHGNDNSHSYICCDPIAIFEAKNNQNTITLPNGICRQQKGNGMQSFKDFLAEFDATPAPLPFIHCGFFGYTSYHAVRFFEDVHLDKIDNPIADMHYKLFRFIIVLNHFKSECYVIQNKIGDEENQITKIEKIITSRNVARYPFKQKGEITSNLTDEEFINNVKKGIHHCQIGDVFQIVLSRKFNVSFKGDDFEVYRRLRSINPSPYAFYFDNGHNKIFGSSPEAQLIVKDGKAIIHPIAGTFRRTGDDEKDAKLAQNLLQDSKENAEHVMLVDLARNDLSKYCNDVQVEKFKEVQYFSHVIHLVSNVSGTIHQDYHGLDVFAATFPAGTLSGAPKIKAMQLIDTLETESRGYYGGAIGFVNFEGDSNHAIMIRTFFSHNNQLTFQAGAGVVAASDPIKEKDEVYNKTAALTAALKSAQSS